jgi:hypothetical protein
MIRTFSSFFNRLFQVKFIEQEFNNRQNHKRYDILRHEFSVCVVEHFNNARDFQDYHRCGIDGEKYFIPRVGYEESDEQIRNRPADSEDNNNEKQIQECLNESVALV